MISTRKGGKSRRSPGGGHGRMNKTISCGWGFPYGGIFLCGQSFLSTLGPFSPYVVGGIFGLPPPPEFFLMEPL